MSEYGPMRPYGTSSTHRHSLLKQSGIASGGQPSAQSESSSHAMGASELLPQLHPGTSDDRSATPRPTPSMAGPRLRAKARASAAARRRKTSSAVTSTSATPLPLGAPPA